MSKGFTFKLDGIRLQTCNARRETMKPEEFEKAFRFAMWANRSSAFWLGDMILAGTDLFGDDFWQYVDLDPSAFDHYERCRGVSAKVPPQNRNPNLSWTHHAMVASVPTHLQVEVLEHAVNEGLNTDELSRYVADLRKEGKFK